jgi:hypothetical protein
MVKLVAFIVSSLVIIFDPFLIIIGLLISKFQKNKILRIFVIIFISILMTVCVGTNFTLEGGIPPYLKIFFINISVLILWIFIFDLVLKKRID